MIVLYQLDSCPFCVMVREKLDALGLPYRTVEVPALQALRTEVIALSGQPYVPVLQDGDVVLDDEITILAYLEERYGSAKDHVITQSIP